jgi:hypothetical protein
MRTPALRLAALVHAFTIPRRGSGPPQALPEECSSMARASVSNSALAIPSCSTTCHLINVFGPKTRSQRVAVPAVLSRAA